MGLRKYLSKRRFHETPEPKGSLKKTKSKKLVFVVQEHDATRLHYDFRLELDGVLKSWAVPKGPSLDPHEHHLAIMTEDHPYDYRKFEGVIPEGNYGAGNVIIWDEGTYEPRADTNNKDPEDILRAELKKGHLTFVMHGQKLKGEFALIKMPRAAEDNAWLLIKKGDDFASVDDITLEDQSVKSGLNVTEIGHNAAAPDIQEYPKVAKPWQVHPMLCTLIDEPFDKPNWLYEIKWDGYRAIATKSEHDLQLYSRAGTDFSESYPPVLEALRDIAHNVILDGEIVVVDDQGKPHFEWLQGWRKTGTGSLHYYIFDILWCDGHDVRTMPLSERKKLLKSIIPKDSVLRYSDHIEKNGVTLFRQMQDRGLEGIVAKDADSPYRENDRGTAWLKIKTHMRQEVVIGGFTEPRGSRSYLGSLVVGVYKNGQLEYVGHSGGGIPDAQRKQLRDRLLKLERKTSPFAVEPKPNAPVHWVRPELVCEMNFTEWTDEGYMRHPAFVGMRVDKQPPAVKREKPKNTLKPTKMPQSEKYNINKEPSMPEAKHTTNKKKGGDSPLAHAPLHSDVSDFTHLDKVFFPKHGYTKGDLMAHYEAVADYMLPYLKDRPHSLYRQPGGVEDHGFFQKNMEHLPNWVPSTDIYSESNQGDLHWIVGGELKTLLYMVQLGCIEINPWNSRVKHLDNPDWIVIDLDPEDIGFPSVVAVAKTVYEVCTEWKIPAYPKTSGKTGIHIYIPLGGKYHYDQAKDFAHFIAIEVNKRQPKITSIERMPKKRQGKIYLDYLQNRQGQTLAAPYSVRPTPDATVATPLHWDEVTAKLRPTDFTIKNISARLQDVGDLWKPVLGEGIDIGKILKHIESTRP